MVLPHANVGAGMVFGAPLPNNYISRKITASPPNFLTPNRLPAVSRPLREDPPAFLWAILSSPKSLISWLLIF